MADTPQPTQMRADYVKSTVGGENFDPDPLGPPHNIDVPFVSGGEAVGGTLTCTMGNWTGEPSEYAYAWQSEGVANGATGSTYNVVPGDAGYRIGCVVTATNANGSTDAPPSNAISIPA